MRTIVFEFARGIVRSVLPYPDLLRRMRVRRRARILAIREPWPRDEAAVTGEDYARLAMLRLLALQSATRRAVQTRQRESAGLLARTAMETCIVGLWCLHDADAARRLRGSEIKVAPALLTLLSSVDVVPQALIRQVVSGLGEQEKLPDVRSMTQKIDSATGATLAIYLYDLAYRPASHYFTHASCSALLRHVTAEYRYTDMPANSWARRAPVRLTDACVGLLAGALANHAAEPTELFLRYSEGHALRVLPPFLVTVGKRMVRRLGVADLFETFKEAREVRACLSRIGPDAVPHERETRVRSMYGALINRLDLDDASASAIQPIIDYLVEKVLTEWDAEHANQLASQSHTAWPDEAQRPSS